MKKTWKIPVTWQMSGFVHVDADKLEDAIKAVREEYREYPLPEKASYVEDSFQLSDDDIDLIRTSYNDNLPDSEEETFVIIGFLDEPIEVKAEVKLCPVTDIMGKQMHNIAIQLYARPNWEGGPEWEPFAMITKPFNEYLSIKNASYMDTNNYPFVTQLLKLGLAQDTGLTKSSGYCSYPLWIFEEEFLLRVGGEKYKQYSDEYEKYWAQIK